jgi:hypothetical protein
MRAWPLRNQGGGGGQPPLVLLTVTMRSETGATTLSAGARYSQTGESDGVADQ